MKNVAEKIRSCLQKASKPTSKKELNFVERYLGTRRKFLCVKAGVRDEILHETVKEVKKMPSAEITKLLDDLFASDTFEYVNFAGKLLTKSKEAKECGTFEKLEKWIAPTSGWAECDSICQSLFVEKDVLENWIEWQKTIRKFSASKNIQLRRASLVLQCKPARGSDDPKLRELAFETIDKLKHEKDVLITKAVSWLLRSLTVKNGAEVRQYLEVNRGSLPKIAYRETLKKIETGKK